ncbi:MAG: sialate O-acetylesterase [Chthoniobacterales bacterium]
MKKFLFGAVFCLLLISIDISIADVRLPAIISDHMVLLKSDKVPVWGMAAPGEEVTVTLDKATAKATAGTDGKWKLELNLKDFAQGPFMMTVQGKNTLTISDVVVGEVWLAGGQSNMAAMLQHSLNGKAVVAASTNPMIREFNVGNRMSETPLDEFSGQWRPAEPKVSLSFSAVSYYFAKVLNKELQAPVGIIMSAYSGSRIEPWMPAETIEKTPILKAENDAALQYRKDYPAIFEAYKKAYPEWLKKVGREDHSMGDVKAFAEDPLPAEGWIPVNIGLTTAPGLPTNGAIWLRKDIEISPEIAKTGSGLSLAAFEGFESIYWNGKLIKQMTAETQPGTEGSYTIIPASAMKEGKNTLAIRLFAPGRPLAFPRGIAFPGRTITGNWDAHVEYVLPALTPEQLAAVPKLPVASIAVGGLDGCMYNAMISPITNYAIRGMLWYQGESNIVNAYDYRILLPAMIEGWRKQWGRGDLPFYLCQLPAYFAKATSPQPGSGGFSAEGWVVMRDSQWQTLRLPKTAVAVLVDLGDAGNIHPPDKKEAGERLAALALANDYGKNVPTSGPVYESAKFENGVAKVKFSHAEGLVAKPLPATYFMNRLPEVPVTAPLVRNSPNGELEGFALCGADKKWFWADAKVQGDSVIVWSDKVPAPIAVRYAWVANPTVNLYNSAGLPAAPFRTDDFPIFGQPAAMAWSEPVNGMSLCLGTETPTLGAIGTPEILVMIANRSNANINGIYQSDQQCIVELNGEYYAPRGASDAKSSYMPPGKEYIFSLDLKNFRSIGKQLPDMLKNSDESSPPAILHVGVNSITIYYYFDKARVKSKNLEIKVLQ